MNKAESSGTFRENEPLTDQGFAGACEILKNPDAAFAKLPPEEQQAYHDAQQSVIDARNSANLIEGKLWIID